MGLGELLNDDESPSEVRDDKTPYVADGSEERQRSRTRAETWARRAAEVAGLVRNAHGKARTEAFENQLRYKAHKLVSRIVLPGEWYLVRWGGTRKGRGTFHTRPGLAIPTVQRTLRPLAFDPPLAQGKPDADALAARWTPKLPEEILGPDGMRSRVRLGHLPAGRIAFSHGRALRLAPTPRADRTGGRARLGTPARHW